MSTEDKMREEHWRQWCIAGMPKDKIRLAEETWKAATEACSAIKYAEIAKYRAVATDNKDWFDSLKISYDSVSKELTEANKEIAARDLMIKELREALTTAENHLDYCGYGDSWEREVAAEGKVEDKIHEALAKSEHRNFRALEKMLLEAELEYMQRAYTTEQHYARVEAVQNRLAELNKE